MRSSTFIRGVSAVEILVGVSILALVVLLAVDAITQSLYVGQNQIERTQALYRTESALEAIRFVRDDDWATIDGLSTGVDYYVQYGASDITLTTTPQTDGGFTTVFQVYDVQRESGSNDIATSGGVSDGDTSFIAATTSWSGGSVALVQYLANIHQ